MADDAREVVIRISGLRTEFGSQIVHDGIDLSVYRGEVLGVVGGSGTGKSVLLKEVIGLLQPTDGKIEIFGHCISSSSEETRRALRKRWGVLFQDGALFSSLTVAGNIAIALRQLTDLPDRVIDDIAQYKLSIVGLPPDAAHKYPNELSGGMRKRAGLARALALDPEIVFLDEPTAGLDPIGAAAFDELILDLRGSLGLTVFMVTHDLDSLRAICDRIAVLVDKRVIVDTMDGLVDSDHPWIHDYFHGPRGRAARHAEAAE